MERGLSGWKEYSESTPTRMVVRDIGPGLLCWRGGPASSWSATELVLHDESESVVGWTMGNGLAGSAVRLPY